MNDSDTKSGPKFDLSDGFGKEDFLAIIYGFFRFIFLVIKIILWPYLWCMRELGRTARFIRHSHDEPLNESEKRFLQSLPLFFTIIGLLGGFAVAIFLIIGLTDTLQDFFRDFDTDVILDDTSKFLSNIAKGSWDAVVFAGSLINGFFEFSVDVFEGDAALALGALSIIGFVLIIGWFVISETGVVQAAFGKIVSGLLYMRDAPNAIWTKLNNFYLGINASFASIIIGTERLETRRQQYFQKVLLGTVVLGIWTFLWGIVLMATRDFPSNEEKILWLSLVLFFLGIITGVVELAFLVRVLDLISRNKYRASNP